MACSLGGGPLGPLFFNSCFSSRSASSPSSAYVTLALAALGRASPFSIFCNIDILHLFCSFGSWPSRLANAMTAWAVLRPFASTLALAGLSTKLTSVRRRSWMYCGMSLASLDLTLFLFVFEDGVEVRDALVADIGAAGVD